MQFWIDRGGTFTDIVARRPTARSSRTSCCPRIPSATATPRSQGIRDLLGARPRTTPIPPAAIDAVKMGTTVATNALLERKGERTVLVITRGFRRRAAHRLPEPAEALRAAASSCRRCSTSASIEVDERVGAHGEVRAAARSRRRSSARCAPRSRDGIRAVRHRADARLPLSRARARGRARWPRAIGFTQVSVSHEVSPLMKLVSPRRHDGRRRLPLADPAPLCRPGRRDLAGDGARHASGCSSCSRPAASPTRTRFQGKDAILSGPAGGIVGAVRRSSQTARASTGSSLRHGRHVDRRVALRGRVRAHVRDARSAGVRMRAPMMRIHTVAAGGGSICTFDGARLRVGPRIGRRQSRARRRYRRGGPLTVTDCNVMLGKLQPRTLSRRSSGRDGDAAARCRESSAKIRGARRRDRAATGASRTPEEVADGFLDIAVENMANAIKHISVQRGYDVTEYTLCCFGGAGGQHACLVADALGMRRVFIHPFAGVLSAYGMGLADVRALRAAGGRGAAVRRVARATARRTSRRSPTPARARRARAGRRRRAHSRASARCIVKYEGTDTTLVVPAARRPAPSSREFERRYRQHYGFLMPGKRARGRGDRRGGDRRVAATPATAPTLRAARGRAARRYASTASTRQARWHDAPVYARERLAPGRRDRRSGGRSASTTRRRSSSPAGGRAHARAITWCSSASCRAARAHAIGTKADPVLLEVFNNLFMAIAEQMGVHAREHRVLGEHQGAARFLVRALRRDGHLIANAPHMPVHLGSMGESVKTIIDPRCSRPCAARSRSSPSAWSAHEIEALLDVHRVRRVGERDAHLLGDRHEQVVEDLEEHRQQKVPIACARASGTRRSSTR